MTRKTTKGTERIPQRDGADGDHAALEARWRELRDSGDTPQAWVDPDTLVVVDCNRALAVVLGVPREQQCGESVLHAVHERDRPALEARLRAGALDSSPAADDADRAMVESADGRVFALVGPDGAATPASVATFDVRDAGGHVQLRRVEWQPLARAARDASNPASVWGRDSAQYQQHLAAVVEASNDAIVCVDRQGRLVAWNAAAERMFGYSADEILGESMMRLIPERFLDQQRGLLERLFEGAAIPRQEAIRRHKHGHELTLVLSLAPLRDAAGEVYAVSGTSHDITEYKRIEAELREAKEAAEAANRSKSQFLANMSHEIRTPMHGVLGMTSVLLGTSLTDEQRNYLEMIQSSGQALLAIINDILDLSKIEAGKLGLTAVEFAAPALVKNVVELLHAQARQKQLVLNYRVDPDVPAQLLGDQFRLQQVLTNLVSNAIKFTERGSVSIRVGDTVREGNDATVRFEVVDTGIGIPREQHIEIFHLFTQVDGTTTRRHGGTGLGLAISRRLVELMGGQIGVDSEPGRGSKFWFSVPLALAEATVGDEATIAGARIAIGCPDHMTGVKLAGELAALGATTVDIVGADELLQNVRVSYISDQPYRLVFVVAGPGGGHAVSAIVRAVRADPIVGDIPVVVVTADGAGDRAAGERVADAGGERAASAEVPDVRYESGADVVLRAPVRAVQLKSAVVEALGRGAVSEPSAATRRADTLRGAFARQSPRVLLVEDNPVNQQVARSILERLGCRVSVADNGARALDVLTDEPWALILMDCQMPVMDGFEATARIRAHEGATRRIPIVAMTADAMRGDRERCLAVGMDDYLPKPFTVSQMAEVLARWVEAGGG